MNQNLKQILSSGWSIVEDLPIAEWGKKYVKLPSSPFGDKYRPEMSPWLNEPLEALKDDSVREIVLNCSSQSSKSTFLYLALAWCLSEDAAPTLFFAPTDELSKRWARTRILRTLDGCIKLKDKMPVDKDYKQLREIMFPQGSLMIGPANAQFAQSWSAKYIFADECGRFKCDGVMSQIRARATQYYDHKILLASTPEDDGDDWTRSWIRTTQNNYNLLCLDCGKLMPAEFSELIKWEVNEKTKPQEYNFEELAKTVYLECPHCKKQYENTNKNWRKMVDGGGYISANKNANPAYAGYRWTALCLPPTIMPWSKLVEEFLVAKTEAASGYLGNLKEFVRLRNAVPWSDSKASPLPPLQLDAYDPDEKWGDYRFAAIDVHGRDVDVFWIGVRSFCKNGDSRLLHYSRASSWEECDAIRKKYNVKSWLTAVDSGWATGDCYSACAKFGFLAMKGEESLTDGYLHSIRGRKVRRPYSSPVRVDVKDGSGRKVHLVKHANNLIKDLLHLCRTARTKAKWSVSDVGVYTPFYCDQIDGEVKKQVIQRRTGKPILRWVKGKEDQHAVDVEAMILVMATIANLPIANRKDTVVEEATKI